MGSTTKRWMTLLLLLPLAACYKHTVHTGSGAPRGPVVYDHWEHFWIGGLVGHTRVELARLCPSGNATVRIKQSFLNGLVTGLTGGIYSPTTVEVRCADGRRGRLRLDEADLEALARSPQLEGWVEAAAPELASVLEEARTDR